MFAEVSEMSTNTLLTSFLTTGANGPQDRKNVKIRMKSLLADRLIDCQDNPVSLLSKVWYVCESEYSMDALLS